MNKFVELMPISSSNSEQEVESGNIEIPLSHFSKREEGNLLVKMELAQSLSRAGLSQEAISKILNIELQKMFSLVCKFGFRRR